MPHFALTLAGMIGAATAIIHGMLTQRLIVRPVRRALAEQAGVSASIRRLAPMLIHYSTFGWLVCGAALMIAANITDAEARPAISLLAASQFAYAAVGNFWGTRGRHPGWMLMAAAVALIIFDALG